MNKLTLQTDKKTFQKILKGEQKIERRYVYPNNAKRYVIEEDGVDENGEPITTVTPVHYDEIEFVNGRRKDAPRMTAEVVASEFVILTDEDGNDMTFEENGEEFYVCQVWYTLGEIRETSNIPD